MYTIKHTAKKLITFAFLLSLPVLLKASHSNNNENRYEDNNGVTIHQKNQGFINSTFQRNEHNSSNKTREISRKEGFAKPHGSYLNSTHHLFNNSNNNSNKNYHNNNSDIYGSDTKKNDAKKKEVRSIKNNTDLRTMLTHTDMSMTKTPNTNLANNTTTYNIYLRAVPLMIEVFELTMLLAVVVVVVKYRNHKILKSSTWPLLLTVVLGCVLLHTAVVLRYFEANFTLCILMSWFRELGFAVVYGSLLLKIYKVSSELRSRRTHRYQASDRDLLRYLSVIVASVVVFMLSYNALVVDSNCGRHVFSHSPDGAPNNKSFSGHHYTYVDGVNGLKRIEKMEDSNKLNYFLGNNNANYSSDSSIHVNENNEKNSNYDSVDEKHRNQITECSLLIRKKVYNHEFLLCRFGWWDVLVQLIESTFLCYLIKSGLKCKSCSNGVWTIIIVIAVELVISFIFFILRWVLWTYSHSDTIFLLYFIRVQLTTTPLVSLIVLSKLWMAIKSTHTNSQEDDGMVKLKTTPRCDVTDFKIENMTADDIRAELKRLYTQLHLHRKTEMMNKNPHISSKKGGRKSVYRRLSLQAFQLRHKRQMTNSDTANEVSRSPQESVTSVDKE